MNLAEMLRHHDNQLFVRVNPSRVPDIEITKSSVSSAKIEVKMIWEMTRRKYYAEIVKDRNKLLDCRKKESYSGLLLQIVFFLQLPNYRYPAGRWYGHSHSISKRAKSLTNSGIAKQWSLLLQRIPEQPAFPPENSPFIQQLAFPTDKVSGADLKSWWKQWLIPLAPFEFDPEVQLKDAAVGFALWVL